ncbi:hypothetical protein [Clostridium thermosuccinogenes]|jgi:hypothetical protein|uniref:hypothetical protein n=1 Tax=Clostridium thermosuccinogenes TaxID=84032 RepID=UPI000CCC4BFF|nr:hypothetical protein [Pseudoclostridium thermosuccinogenes]PNT91065.1 hypothetical protein CDQ83_14690 [Pseudoclostridium thermosuccinogenes]
MKWEEVRKLCPNTYVLLEEIKSHIDGNKKFVDEVALIRTIEYPKEAIRELVKVKGKQFAYHTGNDIIVMEIVKKPGYKGAIDYAN